MYPTINITKYRPISDRAKETAVKQPRFLTSLLLVVALILCLFTFGCKSQDKPAFMRSADDEAKTEQLKERDLWRKEMQDRRRIHVNETDRDISQTYVNGLEKIRTHNESAVSCRKATDQWGVYDTSHCTPQQLKAEQDFENE